MNQNYCIGNSLCLVQCGWSIIYLHLIFKATQLLPFEDSTLYCLPHNNHVTFNCWPYETNIHMFKWITLLSLFSQDDMGPNNMEKKLWKLGKKEFTFQAFYKALWEFNKILKPKDYFLSQPSTHNILMDNTHHRNLFIAFDLIFIFIFNVI